MSIRPKNTRLYNQAVEILHLARNISQYLHYDFSELQRDGQENPYIYFTGDIVRDSDSLLPEILKAENEPFQDDRIKSAHSLQTLTYKLFYSCERLERSGHNGREFIKMLRKELHKFQKQQRKWAMTL